MNDTVARTIYSQLGGNRFTTFTGSKIVKFTDYSLTITLTKNKTNANRMTITLNGKDLYDIDLFRYEKPHLRKSDFAYVPEKVKVIAHHEDIFCDQLEELFTEWIGLVTHF